MPLPFHFAEGEVLLIDKPSGWTSFDVVNKIRNSVRGYLTRTSSEPPNKAQLKVGHAGTLDPLATGLLIVCTGKQTRRIDEFMASEKEYTGTFTLGATTPSYDAETPPDATFEWQHISEAQLRETAGTFTGTLQQVPPMYSAIKKDGKKMYELARKGEQVELAPREVVIHEFEITGIQLPEVHFRVVCSKGTYIRSLAFDFGKALQSGAYLSALRRTRIGEYRVEDALGVLAFTAMLRPETESS